MTSATHKSSARVHVRPAGGVKGIIMARPQTLTPEQIEKVRADLEEYIAQNDDPTIVGFTSSYPEIPLADGGRFYINKNYISDHEEFSELRKKAIEKQEAYLLKGTITNKLNATMGIFRLKQPQHGFTDKQQQDIKLEQVIPILGGESKKED